MKHKIADGYIAYHKEVPYGIWNEDFWTPIQANAENAVKITAYGGVYDNEGTNISAWNPLFAETTCLYWVWKHHKPCKYVLFTQYRRRFDIHTVEELDIMFKQHNVVAVLPLCLRQTLREQYEICHNRFDLLYVKGIIQTLYPEYMDSWNKYIENGHHLFYSNGIIMKAKDFDTYCEWLFTILFEFKKIRGFEKIEDVTNAVEESIELHSTPKTNGYGLPEGAVAYQSQICGFLSERLLTLYLLHNYQNKIGCLPYLKMETGI